MQMALVHRKPPTTTYSPVSLGLLLADIALVSSPHLALGRGLALARLLCAAVPSG